MFCQEGWTVKKTNDNKQLKKPKNPELPGYVSVIDALPHLQEEYEEILQERGTPVVGVSQGLWTRVINQAEEMIAAVMDSGRLAHRLVVSIQKQGKRMVVRPIISWIRPAVLYDYEWYEKYWSCCQ